MADEIFQECAIILNILSFFCSLFVILNYIFFPQLRSFAFKLIFYLQISDFFVSISYILILFNPEEDKNLCNFQAFLNAFAGLSSVFWASTIGYQVYNSVLNYKMVSKKNEKMLFVLAYGVPFSLQLM